MNVKKYLFIFCLLITSNIFGIFEAESPDKTKTAYFDDDKKQLMVKLNNLEKPIETLNFNHETTKLEQILWTQNSQYLIVNIEVTPSDDSTKYNIIERLEIKKNIPHGKPLTPFLKENMKTQITLVETQQRLIKNQLTPYEEKMHQLIKIEIKFQDLEETITKWLDVETRKFVEIKD